ncbi:MAG: molecular chaperone HtpG [Deltaproteobacteria bacterium]|nr:molecular chaperone HtpG [Deltaproteobacteria bacterium]
MEEKTSTANYEFKAEVKQLLDILVHSLYTHKEIFLRELVSNASDALDRLRFEVSRGTAVLDDTLPLDIHVDFDPDKLLVTVTDTGIGLTKDEMVENIGTIAKSGSAEFLKQISADKGAIDNIIGKFGVGFYSVFIVAKEVVIKSKSYKEDEPAVEWRSDGLGTYQLSQPEEGLKRGTQIEIHLRDEAKEFADKHRLESIIKRHSNFISFPILIGGEQVNTVAALWREPKFSIKEEQYNEFYKFLTFDSEPPLATLHSSVDAPVQFNSLLFIPKLNYNSLGLTSERPGLDLYVRRVLIQHGNRDLIPEYLGFVRGVVDSEDLPLNISRETLQENRLLAKVSSTLTKQVLSHLQKTAKDEPDKYTEFWKQHGKMFKLGYSDFSNRDKFVELLRFNSSKCATAEDLVSLDEYIARAKPEQKEIHYLYGQSRAAIALNPHMEIFQAKDIEVLYLFDPLDEFAMESIRAYKDFELKPVEHADIKALEKYASAVTKDAPAPLSPEDEKQFNRFLERVKDILGARIKDVTVSARLSESPCCLSSPAGEMTSSMQKIIQIVSKDASVPQKVFELNKDHKIVRNLLSIYKADPHDEYLTTAIEQLFESSMLLDGYLQDPHALVGRIQNLLNKSSDWYLAVKDIH